MGCMYKIVKLFLILLQILLSVSCNGISVNFNQYNIIYSILYCIICMHNIIIIIYYAHTSIFCFFFIEINS